jgi:beta-phosphoglucomutase-like phosphatase (HAD superfamily)
MTTPNTPTKRRIQAVLFDLDGTLLDTETLSDRAMIQYFCEHHHRHGVGGTWEADTQDGNVLPWTLKQQILGLRGSEWGPIVLQYAEQYWKIPSHSISVTNLWSAWEYNLNALCTQVQLCEGALTVVEHFRTTKNIPLAIATSSRREAVLKKAKNHGRLFQHFSVIVTGDDPNVRQGKPAPDIYLEAAQQLGVHPTECLVVEDALSGVRAGKAAGCTVVAVPDRRFNEEERAVFVKESDYVLDTLTDLIQLNLV